MLSYVFLKLLKAHQKKKEKLRYYGFVQVTKKDPPQGSLFPSNLGDKPLSSELCKLNFTFSEPKVTTVKPFLLFLV